jgi:hypothetical protein
MAARKERNHYIPRVLLNRFCSSRDIKRKVFKVWIYWSEGPVREVSTKDVGLGRFFYGRDSGVLEEQFGLVEAKLGATLAQIDKGIPPAKFNNLISEFVWIQAIRTQSFRQRFSQATAGMLSNVSAQTSTEAARRSFLVQGRDKLREFLAELSPIEQSMLEARLGGQPLEMVLSTYLSRMIDSGNVSAIMSSLLKGLIDHPSFLEGLQKGHNAALSKLLERDRASPEAFNANWAVCNVKDCELLLGDSCVVILDRQGKTTAVRDAVDWDQIYFPISPTKYLLGCREGASPHLTADEINRASASCSVRQFFASKQCQTLADLIPLIARDTAFLTSQESEIVAASVWHR